MLIIFIIFDSYCIISLILYILIHIILYPIICQFLDVLFIVNMVIICNTHLYNIIYINIIIFTKYTYKNHNKLCGGS